MFLLNDGCPDRDIFWDRAGADMHFVWVFLGRLVLYSGTQEDELHIGCFFPLCFSLFLYFFFICGPWHRQQFRAPGFPIHGALGDGLCPAAPI